MNPYGPFETTQRYYRIPTPHKVVTFSAGPCYTHLVYLADRAAFCCFSREEAEGQAATWAERGATGIVAITPEMVEERTVEIIIAP